MNAKSSQFSTTNGIINDIANDKKSQNIVNDRALLISQMAYLLF